MPLCGLIITIKEFIRTRLFAEQLIDDRIFRTRYKRHWEKKEKFFSLSEKLWVIFYYFFFMSPKSDKFEEN